MGSDILFLIIFQVIPTQITLGEEGRRRVDEQVERAEGGHTDNSDTGAKPQRMGRVWPEIDDLICLEK